MANRIPIGYGEFYDFPRMIDFQCGGNWYFLRSYFDEEKDDYADAYDVYLLPFRSEEEMKSHPDFWMNLSSAVHLGQIPVDDLGLDETRRRTIDGGMIERWLFAQKKSASIAAISLPENVLAKSDEENVLFPYR